MSPISTGSTVPARLLQRCVHGRPKPTNRGLVGLVDEISAQSSEFRTWWAGHAVAIHASGTKAIRHPVVGELSVASETLTLASAPDIRIVTCLADQGTPSADAVELLCNCSRLVLA